MARLLARNLRRLAPSLGTLHGVDGLIASQHSAVAASLSRLATDGTCTPSNWLPGTLPWHANFRTSSSLGSLEAEAPSTLPQATYHVEIVTGDVRGAGSPTPAVITLYGDAGESDTHVIGAEETDSGFQRATRKTYVLYSKDLGILKRIHVEQLAHSSSETGTGWYLERIEVKGPYGENWTFPCNAWLGKPDASDTNGSVSRNLIAIDHYKDVHRSSLHDPEHRLTRPLTALASGIAIPHPEKVQDGNKGVNRKGYGYGGEDAYFYASNKNGIIALGVADGVYMWRDQGIDAGEFSQQLMEYCRQAVEIGTTDVLRVLQFAARHVRRNQVKGSSTVCLLLVDALQGRIASANIGDSGFMLLGFDRKDGRASSTSSSSRGRLTIRYRSPQQEHSFGHPYQLGHHENADTVEDAMLSTMPIYPGDVVIMGSDGLFDNLSDHQILDIVDQALLEGLSPSAISQKLAFEAFGASVDKHSETPYSMGATEAFDMAYRGGKADDITVLACLFE